MFLNLRAETQLVNVVDDITQIVTARDFVFDLAEDLTDFVFNRIGSASLLLEGVQIREELCVDEVAEIIPRLRLVVVTM